VLPAVEWLPVIIITRAITVTIIIIPITPAPSPRGFIVPVIIIPPATPYGWDTMDTPATPIMSTAIIIITPPGLAGTNTGEVASIIQGGAVIKDTVGVPISGSLTAEVTAKAIKAEAEVMAKATKEKAVAIKAGAVTVGAVKAVVPGFGNSLIRMFKKGAPAWGAFF
jgi:hypothetical protein